MTEGTQHCPNCDSTSITQTCIGVLTSSDGKDHVNDAWCQNPTCEWKGKVSDLIVKQTFADKFMERIKAPPIR